MKVLSRRDPVGEALRARLRKSLKAVCREFDHGALGVAQPEAHATRRQLKYLLSLLVMVRPAIGEKRFRRETALLGRASKVLAGRRKNEAMMETVSKLQEMAREEPQIEALKKLAEAADAMAATDGGIEIRRRDMKQFGQRLASLRREIKSWPLPSFELATYVKGMTRAYKRARKCLARGLSTGRISALHEGRKSVIHHLHHIETIIAVWPQVFCLWEEKLQNLRELLGELHDLDELEQLLSKRGSALYSVGGKSLTLELTSMHRQALVKRIAQSSHLFSEKPKAFARRVELLWRDFMKER